MELASSKLSSKDNDHDGVKLGIVSVRITKEISLTSGMISSKALQDGDTSTESSSKAGLNTVTILPSDPDPDPDGKPVSDIQNSDTAYPPKDDRKAAVSKHVLDKSTKTISGSIQIPFHAPETDVSAGKGTAVNNNSQVRGEDDAHHRESKRGVESSTSAKAIVSIVKSDATLSYDKTCGIEENRFKKSASHTDAAARHSDKNEDVLRNGKTTPSKLNPLTSSLDGGGVADVTGDAHLESSCLQVAPVSSKDSLKQSTKSADQYFFSHLGLEKISKEPNQADAKAKHPVQDEVVAKDSGDKTVDPQMIAESVIKDCAAQLNVPSQLKILPADQHVKVVSEVSSNLSKIKTLKFIRPLSDKSSVAEGDSAIRNNDGKTKVANTTKNLPLYIKVKLEDKDVTIICCPVALLLQHKDKVDVTLREYDGHVYSITCRMCSHEVSEPYAMLQHLKAEHQIQGCLQKLLNLNSQYLGCMSQPTCVNIPGVLTLPDGLSDMEQGVIRFSSAGIPRLSFVCRLCPLNFHTARGLSAHHHYFMRSMLTKDQPGFYNAKWTCKLCPRQFPSFLDYYAHNEWMRVSKDLFVNTDPIIKKKFEVINEYGKVVASVEVPGSRSLSILTRTGCKPTSIDNIGWGHKANLAISTPAHSCGQSITETAKCQLDSEPQIPRTTTTKTTPNTLSSKLPIDADKGKKTAPPIIQTLDNLCRMLVQKGDVSSTTFDKASSAGDKQNAEEHEYMCAMCHKTFPRLAQMQGHMGSHVRRHRLNKYAPPVGVMAFSSEQLSDIDGPTSVEPKDIGYKCGVCSETFPKLNQMRTHMECHNRPHPATKSSIRSLDTAFSETVKLMSLTCDICKWSFSSESKLWSHRMTHTKEKKTEEEETVIQMVESSPDSASEAQKKSVFACTICKKSFPREVNLRFHLKRHATENVYCALDESLDESPAVTGYRSKEKLDPNKPEADANQDSVGQHVCDTCGRLFDTSKQLRSHISWHTRVKGETESPPGPKRDGGVSRRSHTCNMCNKSNSSFLELRLHKKKHINSRKFIVGQILASEESDMVNKRTRANRSCNEKKKGVVADKNGSDGKITRNTKRLMGQSTYKYYCKCCNRYFRMSKHLEHHMALHSHLESGKAQTKQRKALSRGRQRHFQTREVKAQKQKDGKGSLLYKVVHDSITVLEDKSQAARPSNTDIQHLDGIASSKPSDKTTKKKDGEIAVNSTEDASPMMVEDTIKDTRPRATDKGSPESKKVSSQTSNDATDKPDSELTIHSPTWEDKNAEMDDTSRGARPITSEAVISESNKEHSSDSDIDALSTVFDPNSSTMEVASQEKRPNAYDSQSPETSEEHSQTCDRTSQKTDGELSAHFVISDNSSGVMEDTSQETRPVTADVGPPASPSIDKGHFQTSDEQMQKKESNLTIQSTLRGDVSAVSQETRSSATDTQSNKNPSSDECKMSDVATKKQQDSEHTACLPVSEDASDVMESTSQGTRPSASAPESINAHPQTSEEHPQTSNAHPQTSEEHSQTSNEATIKQEGGESTAPSNCDELNAVVEDTSQGTRPSTSDVQYPETDKAHSHELNAVVEDTSQGTRPSTSNVQYPEIDKAHSHELNAVVEDTSQETRPTTSDVQYPETYKAHSHELNAVVAEDTSQGTRPSTSDVQYPEIDKADSHELNAVVEDTSQETRPTTSDVQYPETYKAHSHELNAVVAEDTSQGTRPSTSDVQYPETDKAHSHELNAVVAEDTSQGTRPSTSDVQSPEIDKAHSHELNAVVEDTSRGTRPSTSDVQYPEIDKAHSHELNAVVAEDTSQGTRPITSDVQYPETDKAHSHGLNAVVAEDTSQGTRPSTSDVTSPEIDKAHSHELNDVMADTSQGTRPSTSDVQSPEIDKASSQTNNASTQKQKLCELTSTSAVCDDSYAVIKDITQERNPNTSDDQSSECSEVHSQTISEFTQKQNNDLTPHITICDESNEVMEYRSQGTRPITCDTLSPDSSKQDGEFAAHSLICDNPSDNIENTYKETKPITFDVLFAENTNECLKTTEVLASNLVDEFATQVAVCDESTVVMQDASQETGATTSFTPFLEVDKGHTETGQMSKQKQEDDELTALSTDYDDPNIVMSDTSQEDHKQASEVPIQKQDSNSTAHIKDCDDLSAVLEEKSQGTRPNGLPVEDQIFTSGNLGNSDKLNLEASEDESVKNTVQETKIGGEQSTRSVSGNQEHSQTSKVHVPKPIQNDNGAAAHSKVDDYSKSGMMGVSQETRSSVPNVQSQGKLSTNIGLSQIILKLRQKLGCEPTAQCIAVDDSKKAVEETSLETRSNSLNVRAPSSDTGHSHNDDHAKCSTVPDSSSLVDVDASHETRLRDIDVGKTPVDQTHSKFLKLGVHKMYKIKCSECERTFFNVNQLKAHKRVHIYANKVHQHHKNTGRCAVSKRHYRCEICLKTFKDYKKLCGHLDAHASHKMTNFKKLAKSRDSDTGSEIKSQKANCDEPKVMEPTSAGIYPQEHGEYICKFCDKSFHRMVQLRSHVMCAHPLAKGKLFLLRPFMCDLCGKSFTKSRQRQIHMKYHVRNKRRQRLQRTMVLEDSDHTYFKKPPSDIRNTSLEASQSQRQDVENASERSAEDSTAPNMEAAKEKLYKCQLCEKSFIKQQQLAEHMNIHKRYSCTFCDASFTLARQLCGHLKVHGGLKRNTFGNGNQNYSSSYSLTPRPVTRLTANCQSNALLKRVIKMYLSGVKTYKKTLLLAKGRRDFVKWFQPKRSFQHALMKIKRAKMQNMYAVLRKSVILEIDADSNRLVYECKECKKSTFCHRAVLRHYLETHLQEPEEKKETPPASSAGKEDSSPEPHQRFRNKSKIGCPICKGSSGFQCHLHNKDELIYIDSLMESDDGKDLFACDKCEQRFRTHSKLVQHRQVHSKRRPGDPFICSLCPFQAQSSHGLSAHQQVHREKVQKKPLNDAQESKSKKPLSCPLCPFKVKNIYALAAHSRIHKGGKGRKRSLPTDAPSPAPCLLAAEESTTVSPVDEKQRKKSYDCTICFKYFYTLSSYHKHIKMHKELFWFKCDQCACSFRSTQELHVHFMTLHAAKNSYHCTDCSFSSMNNDSLQRHLKVHVGAKEKKDRKANWSSYLSNVLHEQVPGGDVTESDRKATWSAYLNDVLRTRGPGTDAAEPDKSSLSPSHTNQDGKASQSVSNQKPNHDGSQIPKSSQPEVPIVQEAATKPPSNSATPRPVEHGEGSPQRLSDSPDEYFACSQCKDFQAFTKEEWDSHMSVVHKGSPGSKFQCLLCQYTTSKEERMEQHMKLHRIQTLQCNTCPYRTPQRHLMIRHVQTVHKQHKPFKCKLCTYCTSYRHHLRRHSEKHKNPNFRCRYRKLMKKGDWHSAEAMTSSSRVMCNECGRELLNKKTLRNHFIKVHGRLPGSKRPSGAPVIKPALDTVESSDAKQGKRKQPSFRVLHEDAGTTCNDKMYECSVCSHGFKCRSDLNQHMAQGHSETKASIPCQCPQCGLVTGSGQLQAHMLIHQEENLLVCEEESCDFKTAESVHMKRHQTKHTAERDALITCRFCQIKFSDTSSLRMHNIQNHSDQTRSINARAPFMCSLCPFTSTNEKDANRHFRLHNYNLAFKCEYCVFSSSTASAIATHQKIHRYPRRNISTALVSKKASQRQKIRSGSSSKSEVCQDGLVSNVFPVRSHPKHVFVTNKGKKLYECRYCQRFFEVAEAWQRHELRHMAEWPQY